MQIMVDGVEYAPAGDSHPRVGIAITTHNRPDTLATAIEHHLEHRPPGAPIVVIDDGSTPPATVPDGVTLVRHEVSRGIPAAKNTSLAALMDLGCEYLSLWDDDAWPIADGWHLPYVASPEHHLSYQFEDLIGARKLRDVARIWDDGRHVALSGQRGVMLWYSRRAIETVGGFDPIYGRGYYEHVDLACRIHEAGLTTFRYMDVAGSDQFIYSLDEHGEVTRTTSADDHTRQVEQNASTFNCRRDSRDFPAYVEYRDRPDVVLTSLLTGAPDPQRGTHMPSTYAAVKALAESVRSSAPSARLHVFSDGPLDGAPDTLSVERVGPTDTNPYFARWAHTYQWLRDRPEVSRVVVCDGTDVEFLRDPFPLLPEDRLVVGEEFEVLACEWIVKNHSWDKLERLFEQRGRDQLRNAGVLAGRRDLVMAFLHDLITEYEDYRFDVANGGRRGAGAMVGDMPIFNLVAHRHAHEHGPQWTTSFKREERTAFSVFKHK